MGNRMGWAAASKVQPSGKHDETSQPIVTKRQEYLVIARGSTSGMGKDLRTSHTLAIGWYSGHARIGCITWPTATNKHLPVLYLLTSSGKSSDRQHFADRFPRPRVELRAHVFPISYRAGRGAPMQCCSCGAQWENNGALTGCGQAANREIQSREGKRQADNTRLKLHAMAAHTRKEVG